MTELNTSRHLEVFNCKEYNEKGREVHIIGCGATGSKVALEIAKLGVDGKLLHLYDDDIVEEHNLPNQAFLVEHVGKEKVVAISEMLENITSPNYTNARVTSKSMRPLKGHVFVLTDTMSSRKDIFSLLKYNGMIDFIYETRLDKDNGRVYNIDPKDIEQVKEYEATLYDDSDIVNTTGCGNSTSVGYMSSLLASIAVGQFIARVNNEPNTQHELLVGASPYGLYEKNYKAHKEERVVA